MAKTGLRLVSSRFPPPAHPFRAKYYAGGPWYRVHSFDPATGAYAPNQFNDNVQSDGRFSPLVNPSTNKIIPTLYAAATPSGAIAEVILHDVPTPSTGYVHDWQRDKDSSLHLSEIMLPGLNLINLTKTGVQAAGLRLADLFGDDPRDYPRTRAWAFHIWQNTPTAHGLRWMSVRENSSAVVMLFGDRVPIADIKDAKRSLPIAQFELELTILLEELGASAYGLP